jgi:hypothetical protein
MKSAIFIAGKTIIISKGKLSTSDKTTSIITYPIVDLEIILIDFSDSFIKDSSKMENL